jgi:hypothetical protein
LLGVVEVNLFIDNLDLVLDLCLVFFQVHRTGAVAVPSHVASDWDVKVAHVEDRRVNARFTL